MSTTKNLLRSPHRSKTSPAGFAKYLLFVPFVVPLGCTPSEKTDLSSSLPKRSDVAKSPDQAGPVHFEDTTTELGLHHVYDNGEDSNLYVYLESVGSGVAAVDFDLDGWPDLFFPGGGKLPTVGQIVGLPGTAWRNRFGEKLVQVTEESSLGVSKHYTMGAQAADFNSDGFPDLLITGYGGVLLMMNQGDGTFIDVTENSGVDASLWCTSAAFADFNRDGILDLFVAQYIDWSWENNPECKSTAGVRDICPPAAFKGLNDRMYFGKGDGSFQDASDRLDATAKGKGLGVLAGDFDQDSWVDVYVANDTTNNLYYQNLTEGKFEEVGVSSGSALDERGLPTGSMGVATLDYDNDLKPDIWVCNYEHESFALYKNEGNSVYRGVSSSAGLTALGTMFVAFGTATADFDCDGDEDIAVTNGHVLRHPPGNSVEQLPLFLSNNGKGKLIRQEFSPDSYFSKKWRGRGMVAADMDQDGDLDLIVSHVNQPSAVLENTTQHSSQWLQIELKGTRSNRDAIGSQVVLVTDKAKRLRLVCGGGSYLSQGPYSLHFGIPPGEEIQYAEISWPDGQKQRIEGLLPNQKHVLIEPQIASISANAN